MTDGSGGHVSSSSGDAITVLLAEDSLVSQKLATALLRREGLRVEVATTGREALDRLSAIRCRIVFMDVQMPEMDGFEATKAIRRGEVPGLDPDVPVIAMTAHTLKGDRERCLAAGMTDYLTKPIEMDELRRILFQYLHQRL